VKKKRRISLSNEMGSTRRDLRKRKRDLNELRFRVRDRERRDREETERRERGGVGGREEEPR